MVNSREAEPRLSLLPNAAKIWKEQWDVDRRLAELGLDRKGLLRIVSIALAGAANATPFHPANASGTFAYPRRT